MAIDNSLPTCSCFWRSSLWYCCCYETTYYKMCLFSILMNIFIWCISFDAFFKGGSYQPKVFA